MSFCHIINCGAKHSGNNLSCNRDDCPTELHPKNRDTAYFKDEKGWRVRFKGKLESRVFSQKEAAKHMARLQAGHAQPDQEPEPAKLANMIFGAPPEGVELNEPVLEDDYPMHCGYVYVADGKVVQCMESMTVGRFKVRAKKQEVRRCDMSGRNLFGTAVDMSPHVSM